MGCGLSSVTDRAVAAASARVEKNQVVEKAVQRALQAAVSELQEVEIKLCVTPRSAASPTSPASAASVTTCGTVSETSERFSAAGLRRGRAADQLGATSITCAEAVLITEEGWKRFFYYPFGTVAAASEVCQQWQHTARILYRFDADQGFLTKELEVHGGANLGLSLPAIRSRAEPLLLA
ncbi:unnamed protein product [Effrenium voratum]|nr:unnamed protein product [Effrenium voratum]